MEMNHHELIVSSQPDVPAAAVQPSTTHGFRVREMLRNAEPMVVDCRFVVSSRPLSYRMRFSMRQDEQPGMSVVTKLFGGEDLGSRIGAVMRGDWP